MSDELFLADKLISGERPEPEWQVPVAGLELDPAEISVSAAYQADKLTACGIDPALFGNRVDPAFFIGIGIQAGIRSGISAEGNVNMLQQITQYRPALLGEALLVRGTVTEVIAVPRGHRIQTRVTFEDAGGELVIDASRNSLRPDLLRGAARGAGERPAPVVPEPAAARQLASHTLTPVQVKSYSMEGNSIHYEEAAAKAAGFRAPMIGGGMGVHFLTSALWARAAPRELDLDVYFRRPIFWDEHFTSAVIGPPDELKGWEALCLLRDEGDKGLKVLTEARLKSVVLDA